MFTRLGSFLDGCSKVMADRSLSAKSIRFEMEKVSRLKAKGLSKVLDPDKEFLEKVRNEINDLTK
jgi:hypothetical protein